MKKNLLHLAVAILLLVGISALAGNTVSKADAIPVISLEGDCLIDYSNWNDKSTYYSATLTFTDGDTSFTQEIEIKPQGTSSMAYSKKNFTVKLSEGVELAEHWGVQKKFVLKADYIDPTHSSNVVSAKLAAEMNQKYGVLVDTPNYGVIDGFPVWVKINGEDAGIFSLTIPKDAWLFNMDEDNPNHLVLACEGWSDACAMRGYDIDFEADWTFEVGEPTDESKAAFKRVVEFVATADDKTFVEQFEQYLDLDACLNYMCFINIAYGHDNVTKNLLMATYDGQIWYPILYDLDSLWGINWDGTGLAEPNNPWNTDPWSDGNNLFYRVNKLFGDQVRERYWELREGILSKEHIIASFREYTNQIPQEYYTIDQALWNADGDRIRTIDLMSRLMDEYLPIVDEHFSAEKDPSTQGSATIQSAAGNGPMIHYVWETNGVQQSTKDIDTLPVAMTFSYTLDGNAISVQELAGKSGHLEAVLHVERRAEAEHIYGVAALVHTAEEQCENITVIGGTCKTVDQEYVCMGSAWLGGTNNVYEMHLSMDVIEFDPAEYMVVVSPVYVEGGGEDRSLDVLLAAAGELDVIINEGILLYDSMVELHEYLTNMQNSLTVSDELVRKLISSHEEAKQDDALSIMRNLLTDAEADADAMLTELGYEAAADAASADRVKMLSEVVADAQRTETEKARASEQLKLIENYLAVVAQLEETKQALDEINEYLTPVATNFPDLVGAYSYANDRLYAILYKLSTLYQNLANYYFSYDGGGDFSDFTEFDDWYEVIIFSNDEGITIPYTENVQ